MPPDAHPRPQVLPTSWVLDDLELLRLGVPDLGVSDRGDPLPPGQLLVPLSQPPASEVGDVELTDPEGVPLARLPLARDPQTGDSVALGNPHWLSPRPERPFETHHRPVPDVPAVERTVIVDGPAGPADVVAGLGPDDAVLVVAIAAVERDGAASPGAVEVCRSVAALVDDLTDPGYAVGPVNWVIAPVQADHPRRGERIAACATAYARGGAVHDLTGTRSPTPTPAPDRPTGAVLFLTGLSGSGKSTLARAVRNRLLERSGRPITLLDGDVVRRHLSAGLGFSVTDRDTNIRRIGWVAAQIAGHGGLAICSPIAPFEATRRDVQAMVTDAGGRFVLVHVATPLAECERRDRKGLYARARRGEIPDFTGISSPYEEPVEPDLRVDTTDQDVARVAERILALGEDGGMWDL